ncbi:hypothetical protein HDU76_011012, partial [Blyttiomyces sp. JEL0837]
RRCSKEDCPATLDEFRKPEVGGYGFKKEAASAREQARQVALMNARLEQEAVAEERRKEEAEEAQEKASLAANKAQEAVQEKEEKNSKDSKEADDGEWKLVVTHKKGATAVKPQSSNNPQNYRRGSQD